MVYRVQIVQGVQKVQIVQSVHEPRTMNQGKRWSGCWMCKGRG